jgi:hypothetical protein
VADLKLLENEFIETYKEGTIVEIDAVKRKRQILSAEIKTK